MVALLTMHLRCAMRRAENVINNEISLTEDETARVLEESSRVFNQNNALVATVQRSDAFAAASAACTAWMMKVCGATLVAVLAAYAYRQRPGLSLASSTG